MPTFVQSTSSVGAGVTYASTAFGETAIFLQGVTYGNTTTGAVATLSHFNNSIYNMATLFATVGNGIQVSEFNCEVTNAVTGTITSFSNNAALFAISVDESQFSLSNFGAISAVNANGVKLNGSQSFIDNQGSIFGGNYGVSSIGVDNIIQNAGSIQAGGNGFTGSNAILVGGGIGQVFNSGLIVSQGTNAGAAIQVISSCLIVNSGTIRSDSYTDGAIDASSATGNMSVTNSGSITATLFGAAIKGSTLSDQVFNTGVLIGSVQLGAGSDFFDGIGGRVTGFVYGGADNDTYAISDPLALIFEQVGEGVDNLLSTVSFSLVDVGEVENLTLLGTAADGTGNALGNILNGNIAANRLFGDAGGDAIAGYDGDDLIDGGADGDQLDGGTGDDRVLGRAGDDMVFGDDGEDWLTGGNGADTIYGGDGSDTLTGGANRDSMTGGADADLFVFRTASDTGIATWTRDIIADFEAGLDVLDLSGVDARIGVAGNQAFTWLGTGAFTGVAGQLRYFLSGSTLIVEGTLNADLVADFTIRLNGETALAVDDLIL